jgi:hypothetical protein
MMTKVHVINSQVGGKILVHAVGCRDIKKQLGRSNSDWQMDINETHTTIAEAVADDLNEECGDDSWLPDHITVLPCCNKKK